jgi:UDP-glucuronate decarboxylase
MNNTLTILNDLKQIVSHDDINWDKLKNSTVLITGSTGMTGQYVVKTLEFLNRFYDMNILIVALTRDSMLTENIMLQCDYFFYAASPSGAGEFIEDELFQCNVIGVFNVLNFLKNKPDRKLKGFVFFSSGEALHPSNHYGRNKRTGENLCRYYNSMSSLPTYIVRFDHTFAPTMNLEKDKRVFAEFVKNILKGKELKAINPKETRTFTYITDAMDGLFRAVLNGETGEYNISNPKNIISIETLAYCLTLHVNPYSFDPFKYIPTKETTKDSLDISALLQLNYKPKMNIIEGFSRVISHFKELENVKKD